MFLNLFFLFGGAVNVLAQNTSNKGKDFWLGYGNHQRGYNLNNQKMVLYITSDVNTEGTIEIPGIGYSAQFQVAANSIREVQVPQDAYLEDEGTYHKGIHVTTLKPVVIYAHIYDLNVSGATLVLPTNVLGKEYYSINYKQISNQDTSFSYFFVVGIEDGTEVEIIPSAGTKGGHPAGVPYVVNLNKGDIHQVLGASQGKEVINVDRDNSVTNYKGADLTGSVVRSVSRGVGDCKKIAVFSGSGKIGIGCPETGVGSSDNLYQQVYPTNSWGKKTITVPLASRDYDIIRIVKSSPSASVRLNGNLIPASAFINDFYYEFESQSVNVIEADLPVQVVQYAVSQSKTINCTGGRETTGDPEMIYLNSIEQNIDRITVYSPGAYRIQKQFINIVIETAAAADFKLDDATPPGAFQPVPGDPAYSYAQLSVNAGVHTLSAPKGFNAVAYGFGRAESYGYSAGTNVKGETFKIVSSSTGNTITNGCTAQAVKFSVDLLFEVKKITWNFDNGEPPIEAVYSSPSAIYSKDGKTYYTYRLTNEVSYKKPGDYSIEVTAEKKTLDACGVSEFIQLDFSVFDPPEPDFSFSAPCEKEEIQFMDLTDGKGASLKSWLWDFGDGTTSADQNPTHTYIVPGTYQVTLITATESSCDPVTKIKPLFIFRKPVPGFTFSAACAGQKVSFSDQSVAADGNIISRTWDYGDGTIETVQDDLPREHIYITAGTYTVKLTVLTDNGCSQQTSSDITVQPVALVDFLLPKVCLEDSFAEFKDLSSISDGTESDFSYDWDFGDQTPHSADKNPLHAYSASGYYEVSLTVTSKSGCVTTAKKILTVNGSNPVADFDVVNPADLCSRNPVIFVNRSHVGFGNITRLEWYFDYDGDRTSMFVDDNPEPGREQGHLYPRFASPNEKTYRVLLKAFSGKSCVGETEKFVKIKAVPDVRFDLVVHTICQEDTPVRLRASETSGNFVKLADEFKGEGISGTGIFNPAKAGPGMHLISYIYTAGNSCADTVQQLIRVNASPSVSAGADIGFREGASVRLKAVSDPDIVKYEWSPAAGLSRTDIPDPVASPSDNTTYTLTVTNSNGCRNSSRVNVMVEKYPVIRNTFTPNGDGVNDTWVVGYLDRYPEARVEIFNRYGNRVYKSQGYLKPWDGTFNGTALPDGVYYYIIDPQNGMGPYTGNVSIIR
ncbi:PKD domain-containing protein [Pararcticibacter amylolyticus]|uniref:PKD domain-containing protein n=1 Tax=Pararcticibacter amylolyticus TaxID=2173175 RepID=UPI0011B27755|nr:PKD domain-containing protein [Pararcticibacter amylolyticus]